MRHGLLLLLIACGGDPIVCDFVPSTAPVQGVIVEVRGANIAGRAVDVHDRAGALLAQGTTGADGRVALDPFPGDASVTVDSTCQDDNVPSLTTFFGIPSGETLTLCGDLEIVQTSNETITVRFPQLAISGIEFYDVVVLPAACSVGVNALTHDPTLGTGTRDLAVPMLCHGSDGVATVKALSASGDILAAARPRSRSTARRRRSSSINGSPARRRSPSTLARTPTSAGSPRWRGRSPARPTA